MPKFRLTIYATAEIEEIWDVEAADEDAARAIVDENLLHRHSFVSDRVMGEERDRVLERIEACPT